MLCTGAEKGVAVDCENQQELLLAQTLHIYTGEKKELDKMLVLIPVLQFLQSKPTDVWMEQEGQITQLWTAVCLFFLSIPGLVVSFYFGIFLF